VRGFARISSALVILVAGSIFASGCTGRRASFFFGSSGVVSTTGSVQIVSGNNQAGPAGTTLAQPLVIVVNDGSGKPLSGQTVVYSTSAGIIAPQSTSTDASGRATANLTFGSALGPVIVTANVGTLGTAIFTEIALPGAPTAISIVAGDAQSATTGTTLSNALVVQVTDAGGNVVPATNVTFAAGTAGGSVTASTATTNGVGQAQVSFTLGSTAGTYTAIASITSGTGTASVTFTETATAPPAPPPLPPPPPNPNLPNVTTIQLTTVSGIPKFNPGTLNGIGLIAYSVQQQNELPANITVEYDDGSGAGFRIATQAQDQFGPAPFNNLNGLTDTVGNTQVATGPSAPGRYHVFSWDTVQDLPATRNTNVTIRVSATLAGLTGANQVLNGLSGQVQVLPHVTVDNSVNFTAKTMSATGGATSLVRVADINQDGIPDIVWAIPSTPPASGPSTFQVQIGFGDGAGGFTFVEPFVFTVAFPAAVVDIQIGDFDGDPFPDIFVLHANKVEVIRSLNPGGPYLGFIDPNPIQDATNLANPHALALADLNHDGLTDVVAVSDQGIFTYLQNGATPGVSFAPAVAATLPGGVTGIPAAVAIGDLDGDGTPDVVVGLLAASGPSPVQIFKDSTAGVLTAGATLPAGANANNMKVAVADLNHDGRLDIVALNGDANDLSVFLQPSGGFTNATAATTIGTGGAPRAIVIDDLDGDGNLDLAVVHDQENFLLFYRGTGTGSFFPAATYVDLLNSTGGYNSLVVARGFNHGGDELLAPGESVDEPQLFAGNKSAPLSGTLQSWVAFPTLDSWFTPPPTPGLPPPSQPLDRMNGGEVFESGGTGPVLEAIAIADFNGDGKPDIAALERSTLGGNGDFFIKRGLGDGTFVGIIPPATTLPTLPVGNGPSDMKTADLNRDGKADLVVVNKVDGDIQVFLGNGDTTFHAAQTYPTGVHPVRLALGDIDGDGVPDAVVLDITNKAISVLRGKPDGSFGAPTVVTMDPSLTFGPFFGLAVGDLTGDGKAEVAVGGLVTSPNPGPAVLKLTNTTTGSAVSFTQTVLTPSVLLAGALFFDVAIGNLNGSPSIVAIQNGTGSVCVFSGGVGSGTVTQVGANPLALALVDVDGDGKLEIVTASIGTATESPSVFVLFENGSVVVEKRFDVSIPGNLLSEPRLAFADMNGDGALDMVLLDQQITLADGTPFTSPTLELFLGNGKQGAANWSFVAKQDFVLANGGNFDTPLAAKAVDMDGDGNLDVVVLGQTASNGSELTVLLGDGKGGLTAQPPVAVSSTAPSGLAVGDLDGDGKPDVVVTVTLPAAGGDVFAFKNTSTPGSVSFAPLVEHPPAGPVTSPFSSGITSGAVPAVAIADMDGDGQPDLVVLRPNPEVIFLGAKTGLSLTAGFSGTPTGASGLVVADFTQDGAPDILVVDQAAGGGDELQLFTGLRSGGGYSIPNPGSIALATIGGLGPISNLTVQDLNRDGFLDVLFTRSNGGTPQTWFGKGKVTPGAPNTWALTSPAPILPKGPIYEGFATGFGLADIDGDGFVDLVTADEAQTAGPQGMTVTVYRGNVGGTLIGTFSGSDSETFACPANTTLLVSPFDFGDFNHDGHTDIVAVNSRDKVVSLLFGRCRP
jgi:hypothetical protein